MTNAKLISGENQLSLVSGLHQGTFVHEGIGAAHGRPASPWLVARPPFTPWLTGWEANLQITLQRHLGELPTFLLFHDLAA